MGLGCGGSLAAVLTRSRRRVDPLGWMWGSAVGFAVSLVPVMLLTSRTHDLGTLLLVNTVPFVFAGLLLALAFGAWPARANDTYCFDLAGAAAGCLLIVVLLDRLRDAGLTILVLAAIGAVAAVLLGARRSRSRAVLSALVLLGVSALAPVASRLFAFGPQPDKFYGQLLARGAAGATVDRQAWNYLGRLDSVVPGPAIEELPFARGTKQLLDGGCDFRLLFSNGYNWSFAVDFRGAGPDAMQVFTRSPQTIPYLFTHAPDVLNIGSGGGVDVYQAVAHGARTATGVEINPLMIEACTRWHAGFWDGLWRKPGVALRELDARTYIETTPETYDVITVNAVDTGGTQASLLAVNFLYTTEAFGSYLGRLRPGGVLSLTRPREQLLRALTAAVAALRARGASAIDRHVVVLGVGDLLTAAVYRDELGDAQLATIRQRLHDGAIDAQLEYAAGGDMPSNQFADYFHAVVNGSDADFIRRAALLIEPITDDWPYFYQLERDFPRSRAGGLLLTVLARVTAAGALLIFIPLLGLAPPGGTRALGGCLLYFSGIGLGFMLTEICLLQVLSLFLGHPAYSISVTLLGMLLFSGLGSMVAGRLTARGGGAIPIVLAAVMTGLVGYALGIGLLAHGRVESLAARLVLVMVTLAPVSFFQGMPLPLKIRGLDGPLAGLAPWAWAVNGFASVAGSVLAVALAMNVGFRVVLFIAAGCYAVALLGHAMGRAVGATTGGS